MPVQLGPFSLDRMVRAVEKVRGRLLRACASLDAGGVEYAVAGECAVSLWVSHVDESAARNTRDVDVMIRRADFDSAKSALEAAGFVHRHVAGMDVFLDGPEAKPRDGVHLIFANEMVREHEALPNPDVSDSESIGQFRVITLDALVRIKLTAFRDKDRTHLRDLIEVGLVSQEDVAKLPAALAERLRQLLMTPEG